MKLERDNSGLSTAAPVRNGTASRAFLAACAVFLLALCAPGCGRDSNSRPAGTAAHAVVPSPCLTGTHPVVAAAAVLAPMPNLASNALIACDATSVRSLCRFATSFWFFPLTSGSVVASSSDAG